MLAIIISLLNTVEVLEDIITKRLRKGGKLPLSRVIIITHTENPEIKIYIVWEFETHILIKIINIYGGHKDTRKLYIK